MPREAEREGRPLATRMRLDREYNLDVTARILLNGVFTFCTICNFNDLRDARLRVGQPVRDKPHDEVRL